jgi:hypothetical protein
MKKSLVSLVVALFLFNTPLFAQNLEISGSASSDFSFLAGNGNTTYGFNIAGGVGYFINDIFEIQGGLAAAIVEGGQSFAIGFAPLFNFGTRRINSFFVGPEIAFGVTNVSGVGSSFIFSVGAVAGKRFAITNSIAYKPYIGVGMVDVSPAIFGFSIYLLSFSFLI